MDSLIRHEIQALWCSDFCEVDLFVRNGYAIVINQSCNFSGLGKFDKYFSHFMSKVG